MLLLGCLTFEELFLKKDLGLFCAGFAIMGVESSPMNETSTTQSS